MVPDQQRGGVYPLSHMAKRQKTSDIGFVPAGKDGTTDEEYKRRIASFIYEEYPDRPSLDLVTLTRSCPSESAGSLGGISLPAKQWMSGQPPPTAQEIEPVTKYIKETLSRRMQGFKGESRAVHKFQDVKFNQACVRPIYEYEEEFLASLYVADSDPSKVIERTVEGQRVPEEQDHHRIVAGYRWYVPIETATYQNGKPRSQREEPSSK